MAQIDTDAAVAWAKSTYQRVQPLRSEQDAFGGRLNDAQLPTTVSKDLGWLLDGCDQAKAVLLSIVSDVLGVDVMEKYGGYVGRWTPKGLTSEQLAEMDAYNLRNANTPQEVAAAVKAIDRHKARIGYNEQLAKKLPDLESEIAAKDQYFLRRATTVEEVNAATRNITDHKHREGYRKVFFALLPPKELAMIVRNTAERWGQDQKGKNSAINQLARTLGIVLGEAQQNDDLPDGYETDVISLLTFVPDSTNEPGFSGSPWAMSTIIGSGHFTSGFYSRATRAIHDVEKKYGMGAEVWRLDQWSPYPGAPASMDPTVGLLHSMRNSPESALEALYPPGSDYENGPVPEQAKWLIERTWYDGYQAVTELFEHISAPGDGPRDTSSHAARARAATDFVNGFRFPAMKDPPSNSPPTSEAARAAVGHLLEHYFDAVDYVGSDAPDTEEGGYINTRPDVDAPWLRGVAVAPYFERQAIKRLLPEVMKNKKALDSLAFRAGQYEAAKYAVAAVTARGAFAQAAKSSSKTNRMLAKAAGKASENEVIGTQEWSNAARATQTLLLSAASLSGYGKAVTLLTAGADIFTALVNGQSPDLSSAKSTQKVDGEVTEDKLIHSMTQDTKRRALVALLMTTPKNVSEKWWKEQNGEIVFDIDGVPTDTPTIKELLTQPVTEAIDDGYKLG